MADHPEPFEAVDSDTHWRNAGDRIQTLLDATSVGGGAARERAEALVAEVVELYGAALQRIVGSVDRASVEAMTTDDLVASVLLVHGLHPHDVARRVSDALDKVRPYLGSHGGDVEFVGVTDGVVRLRFAGSCKSCPSSAVTLELAVNDAIRAAAPEIESIELLTAPTESVIPADTLMAHVRRQPHSWHPAPDLADLRDGEVGGFLVAGTTLLACRVGDGVFAYLDRCGGCGHSLAGARLRDTMLECPRCRTCFDVVHAGTSGDGTSHLDPIPLLERDGTLSLALHAEPTDLSA